jgi:hypothetical protein
VTARTSLEAVEPTPRTVEEGTSKDAAETRGTWGRLGGSCVLILWATVNQNFSSSSSFSTFHSTPTKHLQTDKHLIASRFCPRSNQTVAKHQLRTWLDTALLGVIVFPRHSPFLPLIMVRLVIFLVWMAVDANNEQAAHLPGRVMGCRRPR